MNASSFTCDMFTAKIILSIDSVPYLLLLPVFISVALVGYGKWKKQRSVSHSDAINYHMMALEMSRIVGFSLFFYGTHTETDYAEGIGTYMINMASSGQLLFHCLACGERYLAAVTPITYLRFKKRGGVTIRNISIVVTWLCALAHVMVRVYVSSPFYMVVACLMAFGASMLVTFCSVSVLRVLTGPRPGERGGDTRRMDQSKRSAFNSMLAILGTLLMRFVVLVVHSALSLWRSAAIDTCVFKVLMPWFELPSSLVLPLLFLHREGKLRLWREHV